MSTRQNTNIILVFLSLMAYSRVELREAKVWGLAPLSYVLA